MSGEAFVIVGQVEITGDTEALAALKGETADASEGMATMSASTDAAEGVW